MQFELSEALMDDILFSMEDQEGVFLIDCLEGVVVNQEYTLFDEDEDEDRDNLRNDSRYNENRYIDLPEWDSSDGFRLMERFTAAFRNPLIRNELSIALNQGKGVFRAFKNTLSRYPEAEKLWFSFKEREMKREIIRWYNALREEWGLEKIGHEPEETDDLVLEDFRFRDFQEEDKPFAAELHGLCLESLPEDVRPKKESAYESVNESLAFTAESVNGDFAAYISADIIGQNVFIHALEVKLEYRGLGIGKALLSHLLKKLDSSKVSQVFLDLPTQEDGFSRALIREGFAPCITRYCLSLATNLPKS